MRRDCCIGTVVLLMTFACACGGGSSSSRGTPPGGGPPAASISTGGTTAAADRVRLTGSAAGDTVTVDVQIGGPSTSNAFYGFAFDLRVADPSLLTLLSFNQGVALQPGGSGLTTQVAPIADGWTVGVFKLGSEPGNAIPAGESAIVRLVFRVRGIGSTTMFLDGTGTEPPAAIDPNGQPISSVQFVAGSAIIAGT